MTEAEGRTSRRRLLQSAAAAAGGAALAGVGYGLGRSGGDAAGTGSGSGTGAGSAGESADPALATVPFYGVHQAGVETPAPQHAALLAIDLADGTDADAVTRLMRLLTEDAARLTQGRPSLGDTDPDLAARPASMTVTVGWGARVFDLIGKPRLRPSGLHDIPAMATDRLEPEWSGGDLVVQVCADETTAVSHAVRAVTKQTRAFGTVRWVQYGSLSSGSGGTRRNLLGQVDGTQNPSPGTAEFDGAVWHDGSSPLAGGTLMVVRRIAFGLEAWDALRRVTKEESIGRRLSDGAPLTGGTEKDRPDLTAMKDGRPVIAPDAHVRLARAANDAEKMLRRGFNYDLGPARDGTARTGLLFVAFQRDPDTAFTPVQRRLDAKDALNTWVTHIGSAVFAVLPGASEGQYLGQPLIEA